jgi:hypothetical protein
MQFSVGGSLSNWSVALNESKFKLKLRYKKRNACHAYIYLIRLVYHFLPLERKEKNTPSRKLGVSG